MFNQVPGDATPLGHAPSPTQATWGLRHLFAGLLGGAVLLVFFLGIIALPAEALTHRDAPEALLAQAVASGLWDLSLVFLVYWLARRTGGGWSNLGLRLPHRLDGSSLTLGRFLGLIVVANIAARAAVVIYALALRSAGLDELLPEQQVPDAFFDYDVILAVFAVIGVSIVPIAEETFFRGFLFGGLRRRLPFLVAGLISGVVFSIAHGQFGLILPFTLIGMILAYLYERTGSLATPIAAHFLFNSISFLVLVFVPGSRG